MTKYIKLFEDFNGHLNEDQAGELIYEKWRSNISDSFFEDLGLLESEDISENEDFWDEDDRELTSGERAAMARDFQIISREQLAAIYLKALGLSEGDGGKYLVMVPNITSFGSYANDGSFNITLPALADAIGLESYGTVSRTTKKFENLIAGIGETSSETIYPKIVSAYEYFKTKDPKFIANEIKVTDPAEYTLNRDKAEQYASKARESAKDRKVRLERVGQEIFSLLTSLKSSGHPKFRETSSALDFAVKKISQEKGIDPIKLREVYKSYLKSRGLEGSVYYA
jgi:hypothetical protein